MYVATEIRRVIFRSMLDGTNVEMSTGSFGRSLQCGSRGATVYGRL